MPAGRPTKLLDPARTRPDGSIVTISEAVITAVGLGQDYVAAAKGAGISTATLHSWRVDAARARTAHLKGQKITPKDESLIEFLELLEKAESNAELERLAIIHRASQPHQVVKVVEKVSVDAQGKETLVERATTTETRPGLWTPAAWWLERRIPSRYARRLEVSGPAGGAIPIEDRARTLGDSLATYLAGASDAQAAAAEAEAPVT